MSPVVNDTPLVVAIDGPSGSGKSSTSKGVALRLHLDYLDTGAMYRAATWAALEAGVDLADRDAVAELVRTARWDIALNPQRFVIKINDHDVTDAIRDPRISESVSAVATNPQVRTELVARQQRHVRESARGIVVEGRDITTVVAPDAGVRILLVADPQARVARRQAELGEAANTEQVTDQVIRRDRDDSTVAEFTDAAPGVTVIDSTFMTLDEVINTICDLAAGRSTEP